MIYKILIFIVLSNILYSCATPPQALQPVPSPQQVDWQKMETYAFIHFGLNTYNDMEWGYGNADVNLFNPSRPQLRTMGRDFCKCRHHGSHPHRETS